MGRELSERDLQMMTVAKNRGQVWVSGKGMRRRAQLVAWQPTKNGKRRWGYARVQFSSGGTAVVKIENISEELTNNG